ncbi:MAG: flippase [Patescibacteria group bacterium]
MSYTRKIAHNTIIQIIGKTVSTIIGVVVIGMLTRYLGEGGFGQYTTIMAFLQFFGVLVDMGLYFILVKKISESGADEERISSNIFSLRLVSAIIFLGLAPIIVLWFPYPSVVKLGVLITSISFLAITLNQLLTGIFQKHLRIERVTIAEVAGRIVLLLGTYAAIRSDLSLPWIMAVVSAGSAINFIMLFIFSRKYVRWRWRWEPVIIREVIRDTWPIALSIAFNLVYFKADTIILSLFKSQADVGVYGAAYKVLEVLTTFPAMFAGLILPLLAAAWAAMDRERFARVLGKAFDAMSMIALPLIVGTYFLAQPVMNVIAPEFRDSGSLLRILIVATGIIFWGNVFGGAVFAINRQRTMMWLYLLVAIISLGGYVVFIPRYSYFGAAWMTVASELLVTISAALIVLISTHTHIIWRVFGKAIVASGIMALVLWLLNGQYWLWSLLAGGGVYVVALYMFKAVTKETIRDIISRKAT